MKPLPLLLALTFIALAQSASAQTATNTFRVTIQPPANTLMVTQTVNAVFLTVNNLSLFTNVTVNMRLAGQLTPMLDDGTPPDQAPSDATFSANLLVPPFPAPTNFLVCFLLSGQDLSVTNEFGELLPEAQITATNRVTYVAVTRPANDNFANAIKIPSGGAFIQATNNFASIEPDEPFHGGDPDAAASVWWIWSSLVRTNVLIDTAGSSFAPVLAVYAGPNLADLTFVAASTNDVPHRLKANVNFDAQPGVTYRIAVAGFDTNGVGDIRLSVIPGGQPDTQPPSVNILTPVSEAVVTTNLVSFSGTAKDAPPDATGVSLVQLQLNDAPPILAAGTINWSATLDLPPGTNIVRAVAQDVAGNLSQPFEIVVRYLDPLNDDFANTLELSDLNGTVTARTRLATKEVGEPNHATNDGGHSVWYRFRAPGNGLLQLSTAESTFDTLLAVYTGDGVTNLVLVAANDDAAEGSGYSELSVALNAQEYYQIAVDGFGGATGIARLAYSFTTTDTFYSLTYMPVLGGLVLPPAGLYLAGSTQYVTAIAQRDFEFIGWSGAAQSPENPLPVVMTQDHTLTAQFQVQRYIDSFESGDFDVLPWSTAGSAPWSVRPGVGVGGSFAARSGLAADNQASSLVLALTLLEGTGSFDYRVSSEAGWDSLEFYVNEVLQQRWSGETGWRSYQFAVPKGPARLEWRYARDANFSFGQNAVFIDNLYLPRPDVPAGARLAIQRLPTQQHRIVVQGRPGRSYVIETSEDLLRWSAAFTNTADNGTFLWTDTQAPGLPLRFYRAVTP